MLFIWHKVHQRKGSSQLLTSTFFSINKVPTITVGKLSHSAKMYPIFVLFISPVKIEIFQVCLFHIIGNLVFHPEILRVRVEDAFQALKNDREMIRRVGDLMNRANTCLERNGSHVEGY